MNRKIFLITFLLLINAVAIAQNVTINANVNKPEALVRLFLYNDLLTCEQTQVFETHTDDKGNFKIETTIDDVCLAQIAVNLERVELLLRPNSTYDLQINIPEQSPESSYFERQNPSLKMNAADDNDLYYQYHLSEMIIDDFILDNFNQLYRGRKLSLLDSLDVKIEKELGEIRHDFIKNNIRYKKASVQMAVNNDNAKKVINQYFNKQEVLYSHPAYMTLFNEIFTDYFHSRQFEPSELLHRLYAGYTDFLSYLKEKDAFLSDNKELAELIVAWNLRRMYYENPDERKIILSYLENIKQNSENQRNRQLVNDILKQIKRLSYNTPAPDFSLKNAKGEMVQLSDYKENIVVLQFVNHTSSMIDYQFEKLKELSQQWQDSVKIVTIATEESFDDFRQMFDNKSIRWELLNLSDDILLLEKYQIRTFPDYIILRRGCKIGMAPAPAPDQYLDYHVRRIYKYM